MGIEQIRFEAVQAFDAEHHAGLLGMRGDVIPGLPIPAAQFEEILARVGESAARLGLR